ncbi:hypothetical protein NDU88_007559 [Pleurodeles waltl]|uniref:Uncharacterized protein n=1 Tax=Pleurodeles waltl TaxID=8319 RepID=A0AAV7NYB4_PLEWA|nr:hypothetical protein NDU88_007559 [Pleurodeles waltl]
MPFGKVTNQMLYMKVVLHPRPIAVPQAISSKSTAEASSSPPPDPTLDHILQGISAVGHCLEGMNTKMSEFAAKSGSVQADIAGFQDRVEGVERYLSTVEDHLDGLTDHGMDIALLAFTVEPTQLVKTPPHQADATALERPGTETGCRTIQLVHKMAKTWPSDQWLTFHMIEAVIKPYPH